MTCGCECVIDVDNAGPAGGKCDNEDGQDNDQLVKDAAEAGTEANDTLSAIHGSVSFIDFPFPKECPTPTHKMVDYMGDEYPRTLLSTRLSKMEVKEALLLSITMAVKLNGVDISDGCRLSSSPFR